MWRVRLQNGEQMYATALVVAAPAYDAGKLLAGAAAEAAALLFRKFICSYLGPCFGLQAKPGAPSTERLCESIDHELWNYSKALPQFNVGHAERIVNVQESLEKRSGLYLRGNYLAGRSVGDCVPAAFRAAESAYICVPR
jgi:hypothetical protein